WQAVLNRYGQRDEVVLGVPVSGREHSALENVVGCFINTLPIRLDLRRGEAFAQSVTRHSKLWRRDWQHRAVPLDQIIERLALPRVPGRLPLIQLLALHRPPLSGEIQRGTARGRALESAYSSLGAYEPALIWPEHRSAAASGPSPAETSAPEST